MTTVGESKYKVRLISVASLSGSSSAEQVVFNVTPKFTESREVDYTAMTPVHLPGGIQVYKNTRSRTFTIDAHFISRTIEEATTNMIYLQTLRGWTLPYFGATSTKSSSAASDRAAAKQNQQNASNRLQLGDNSVQPVTDAQQLINRVKTMGSGVELLGAPPDVLYLYAYSSSMNSGTNGARPSTYGVNINKVPVVITSLNIAYPEDVDYIPTFSNINPNISDPFPKKMDVTVTLVETHSPREYERFDLMKFKQGKLVNF